MISHSHRRRYKFSLALLLAVVVGVAMPAASRAQQAPNPPPADNPSAVTPNAISPKPAATNPPATTLPGAPSTNTAANPALDPMADAQMYVGLQQSFDIKNKLQTPDTTPRDLSSVFFTKWQYALIQEAKRGYLSRPPAGSGNSSNGAVHGTRELSLGGIAYRTDKDWTIWLNGQRLTPDALLPQILDLKVTAEHIDIKWFDKTTNLIYPVRLRPHQRFNLDARMFLPGVGTDKG